jgi:hypothetical protein
MARKREWRLNRKYVRDMAEWVAKFKGGHYCESYFNIKRGEAERNLRALGATKEQMDFFNQLVNKAPVKGGRFSHWSGD